MVPTNIFSRLLVALFVISAFSCTKPVEQDDVLVQPMLRSANQISVMSFNILAPCWADPSYYPSSSARYLDRVSRRRAIISLLRNHQQTVDVFALQEVAQVEFDFIKDALKQTHVGIQANHSSTYWSNWITPVTPWEPNGNAIFIKKDRFTNILFEDFPSSASGNHTALFTGIIRNSGGKMVRVASVHLDSDYPYNRRAELGAVIAKWPQRSNTTDIIAGDFNTETDATNIQNDLTRASYYDLLKVLGTEKQTHPWDTKYYGADNWGIIDHIVSRGSSPVRGSVMDFNLFSTYPNDEEMRINQNLILSGSDHFPVVGAVAY